MQTLKQLTDGTNLFDRSETPQFKELASIGDSCIIRCAPETLDHVTVVFMVEENMHADVVVFLKPGNYYILTAQQCFLKIH